MNWAGGGGGWRVQITSYYNNNNIITKPYIVRQELSARFLYDFSHSRLVDAVKRCIAIVFHFWNNIENSESFIWSNLLFCHFTRRSWAAVHRPVRNYRTSFLFIYYFFLQFHHPFDCLLPSATTLPHLEYVHTHTKVSGCCIRRIH